MKQHQMASVKTAFFLLLFCVLYISHTAQAYAEGTPQERYTHAQIATDRPVIHPGQSLTVSTTITLEPHWHVYWENPGDSGLPIRIKWDVPDGTAVSDIQWPVPDKISYDILSNYGYYDTVTLLQTITVPDDIRTGKHTLFAQVEMLVCNEICLPESDTLSLDIAVLSPDESVPDTSTLFSAHIEEAQTKLPSALEGAFSFYEQNQVLHLHLEPDDPNSLKNVTADKIDFFPRDWGIIRHAATPDVSVKDGIIAIRYERGDQPVDTLDQISGLLIVTGAQAGQNTGFEISAQKKQPPPTSAQKTNRLGKTPTSWIKALYLAFLGGLILNLMPCVFPVLSMKTLSLVKMKDKESRQARLHGLSYTAGVMLSFLLFGAILGVLKETGTALGWGFQLQTPIVVGFLAYLLFSVGLNLLGFLEIGTRLSGAGQALTQEHALSSSFFTGTLATIVATPCTAPFMGVAMGFALTQSMPVILSIFAMLGFGLAFPYLFLAFVPPARHLLPRPGAWMNTFKQFLAFPMFASAIWLIWVLSQQTGAHGVLLSLMGLLAIGFAVWLSHLSPKTSGARLTVHLSIAVALILAAVALWGSATVASDPATPTKSYATQSTPYKDSALQTLLSGDDPVFVEMTAAWCITCKVNHAVAISNGSTQALFRDENVQYLIGDWTNQNPEITAYLDRYGRNGVPLYVFYGRRNPATGKRPADVVLPQILTPAIVRTVITNETL